eukprot:586140-Prymnesium_polylepis.1
MSQTSAFAGLAAGEEAARPAMACEQPWSRPRLLSLSHFALMCEWEGCYGARGSAVGPLGRARQQKFKIVRTWFSQGWTTSCACVMPCGLRSRCRCDPQASHCGRCRPASARSSEYTAYGVRSS